MKYRVMYAIGGDLRYLSQLETLRAIERTFRRADIGLVFTEGYSPRPRFSFGPARPVGIAGRAEVFDVILESRMDPEGLIARLNDKSPGGMDFLESREIPENARSIGSLTALAEYLAIIEGVSLQEASAAIEMLRRTPSITYESGEKVHTLVPAEDIVEARVSQSEGGIELRFTLPCSGSRYVRPSAFIDAVLANLGAGEPMVVVERSAILSDADGVRMSVFDTKEDGEARA